MIEKRKSGEQSSAMTIPRSVLFNSLKGAIETGDENRIGELTDILHSGMQFHAQHTIAINENTSRIDTLSLKIENLIEAMKEGFRQMDKRFEQVDKRFEQVDKRLEQIDRRMDQFDKRFELVEKRFELVDRRFEISEKKFNRITLLITAGFTLLTVLITVYRFVSP